KRSADSKYLNGLSPEEAFAPELRYQRPALSFEEYRRAFLLPLAEARVVESRGPAVRVNNRRYVAVAEGREKLWHFDGQPVMVKTDLVDDEHVFLFALDGKYLCEARTERALPYFVRLTCEDDAKLLAEKLREIRAEKKYLDTWVMEETGGWHKLDPWSLYQLPREAFLGKAKLALLDSMYSVKGETHNPKIHVLPEELKRIALDSGSGEKQNAVCTSSGVMRDTEPVRAQTPIPAADPEKVRRLARLLRNQGGEDF
ncbi:MAG: Mu transposase C-terminal domain-containing protein, partial [Lentisphaeria bacterium]|nr:Mu transposase C-terminal domain-containing protein [Lentisphaeria bacterium]